MSSTERAPEPTMEEILASIRRIISDDEASSVQQRATSAEYAEQVRADDTEDGAADTQMIADIERALGWRHQPAPNDDDIDDILDLTEPGGSAADDVMMADEPVTVLEEVVLETEFYEEEPRKARFHGGLPAGERGPARALLSHLPRRHRPSSRRPLQAMRRRPLQAIRRSSLRPTSRSLRHSSRCRRRSR